eukprot:2171795-Alexandrium_andersonii.AAC.1
MLAAPEVTWGDTRTTRATVPHYRTSQKHNAPLRSGSHPKRTARQKRKETLPEWRSTDRPLPGG